MISDITRGPSGPTDLGIRWSRCSLTGGVHFQDGVLGLEQAQQQQV